MSRLKDHSLSKFRDVAAVIRGAIVAGRLQPGERLPSWDDLTRQYGVGRPTLMRAMHQLKRDGFVFSSSTRGTFVAMRPPHLARFGLVFPSHPSDHWQKGWNRFWQVLLAEAPVIEREANLQIPVFFDVCSEESQGYRELAEEIEHNRLAGLIVVGRPDLIELPLISAQNIPKVAIYDAREPMPMPCLYVDRTSFYDQALQYLQGKGRRRIAMVVNTTEPYRGFERAVESLGLESKPFWHLATQGQFATNLVRTLFDPDNAVVPDGLIVSDDNLVEHSLSGLLQAGVRIPHDLEIVVHCNWPAPVPSPVPVKRLGYDVSHLLRTGLRMLTQAPPATPTTGNLHLLPATFDPITPTESVPS